MALAPVISKYAAFKQPIKIINKLMYISYN
jgi:hypothetical protein